MNPLIVIPTYWSATARVHEPLQHGSFDHATPIDKPLPELENCLHSLDKVRGVLRVALLLVAVDDCESAARARVESIAATHANLNITIIGAPELARIQKTLQYSASDHLSKAISYKSYGGIRNVGLLLAALLKHDLVVFMDDDELALNENFLITAAYGLGHYTRQDLPIYIKTGYFLDRDDSPFADELRSRWYDRFWSKRAEFNQWMRKAQKGSRISRSNYVCGGCMAIHASAFARLPFDPWVGRGEDLDYLFNARLFGLDVWFDNEWYVRHLPPPNSSDAARFLGDCYRWFYEREKLRRASEHIGLHRVTPESLKPYPAPWISDELDARIARTSFLRALGCSEHVAYLKILTRLRAQAQNFAEQNCTRYCTLQSLWAELMKDIWNSGSQISGA